MTMIYVRPYQLFVFVLLIIESKLKTYVIIIFSRSC